jgi:hypothetical protein
METMLAISLYCYPHLNQQKHFVFLIIVMSSLQQNWKKGLEAREGWGKKKGKGERGRKAQTMYAHANK